MISSQTITPWLLAVIGLPLVSQQQQRNATSKFSHTYLPVIAIQLEPGLHSGNDLPASFSVLLINLTDGDLHIPKPSVNCKDPNMGTVYLDMSYKGEPGHPPDGCKIDPVDATLEERIASWPTLHAHEIMRLDDIHAPQMKGGRLPDGTYTFLATYEPPSIAPDVKALRGQKIELPGYTRSDVLHFKKETQN